MNNIHWMPDISREFLSIILFWFPVLYDIYIGLLFFYSFISFSWSTKSASSCPAFLRATATMSSGKSVTLRASFNATSKFYSFNQVGLLEIWTLSQTKRNLSEHNFLAREQSLSYSITTLVAKESLAHRQKKNWTLRK